jgi:poly-gamma-glutamate synthesis protein (capsule biosynthesis protein)
MTGAFSRMLASALLLASLPLANAQASDAEEGRLLFAGDVLLAREAAREIDMRGGVSPWSELKGLGHADFAMANFEGAVGDGDGCKAQTGAPCFEARPETLRHLAEAGFTAVGLANNHAGDLGGAGRRRAKEALTAAGLDALTFEDSPGFVRVGRRSIAVVAINTVRGRDGAVDPAPSLETERKLRLARAFADWVVVFVHWGAELKDWPQPAQRSLAEWFVNNGADLVVGHHPHVTAAPECVHGRPVFYSLGNHVFDQKYPESKRGVIADCRIRNNALSCSALNTETPPGTSFPRLVDGPAGGAGAIADCAAPARGGLTVSRQRLRPWGEPNRLAVGSMVIEGRPVEAGAEGLASWKVAGRRVLSAETGRLAADHPPYLLTVERHHSPIDSEDGPRPYVYDVADRGLIARWRGSALAWPLIDARLVDGADGVALLCALHRADSFIRLNPASTGTRTAIYRWAGFGFHAVDDEAAASRCQEMYAK